MIGIGFKFLLGGEGREGGIGQISEGGNRLFDWAVIKGLPLMNSCFQKSKSWLVTFRSDELVLDYILVDNRYRSSVNYVKVISGE